MTTTFYTMLLEVLYPLRQQVETANPQHACLICLIMRAAPVSTLPATTKPNHKAKPADQTF
jgi:hypothetical protein